MNAITTVDIDYLGTTIPASTKFEIAKYLEDADFSVPGEGLPVSMIYKDEYKLINNGVP